MSKTFSFRVLRVISTAGASGKVFLVSVLDKEKKHVKYRAVKQCWKWSPDSVTYDWIREIQAAEWLRETHQNRLLPSEEIYLGKENQFCVMEALDGTYRDLITQLSIVQGLRSEKDNLKEASSDLSDGDTYHDEDGRLRNSDGHFVDELRLKVGSIVSLGLVLNNQNKYENFIHEFDSIEIAYNKTKDKAHETYLKQCDQAMLRLRTILKTKYGFSSKQANERKQSMNKLFYTCAKQASECLQLLQHHGMIHNDFRRGNMGLRVLKDDFQLVCIDFGQSRLMSHEYAPNDGLPHYYTMGPEAFFREPIPCCKSDIWSLGIMLGDLLYPMDKFFPEDLELGNQIDDDEEEEKYDDDYEEYEEDTIMEKENDYDSDDSDDDDSDSDSDSEEEEGWDGLGKKEIEWFNQCCRLRGLTLHMSKSGQFIDDAKSDSDQDYYELNLEPRRLQLFVNFHRNFQEATKKLDSNILAWWLSMFYRVPDVRPDINQLCSTLPLLESLEPFPLISWQLTEEDFEPYHVSPLRSHHEEPLHRQIGWTIFPVSSESPIVEPLSEEILEQLQSILIAYPSNDLILWHLVCEHLYHSKEFISKYRNEYELTDIVFAIYSIASRAHGINEKWDRVRNGSSKRCQFIFDIELKWFSFTKSLHPTQRLWHYIQEECILLSKNVQLPERKTWKNDRVRDTLNLYSEQLIQPVDLLLNISLKVSLNYLMCYSSFVNRPSVTQIVNEALTEMTNLLGDRWSLISLY